ncbi:(E,E)-geranyllinalool synthase, partial [Mucuna pruriens]
MTYRATRGKVEFSSAQLDVDGQNDFPKHCKLLHLTCLKVFQMFYNSSNAFDSNSQLLEDINKAIYLPLRRNTKLRKIDFSLHSMQRPQFSRSFKHNSCISLVCIKFLHLL